MRIFHLIWLTLLTLIVLLWFGYEHTPDFIQTSLSKKFKVPVTVDSLDYSYAFADIPFFELKDLEIRNPKGFVLPNAFSCEGMVFKAPYTRYLDRQIVIQNLIVISPYFSFEFDSPERTKGNWSMLMDNLKNSIDKALHRDRSILIEKLTLHNINADLVYRSEGNKVQSLPFIREIVLSEIRGSGSTVTNNILATLFQASIEALLNAYKLENQGKPTTFLEENILEY